jgi:hypothetical protein
MVTQNQTALKFVVAEDAQRNRTPVIVKLVDGTFIKGVLHWKKLHQRLIDALNHDDLAHHFVISDVATRDGIQSCHYLVKSDRIAYLLVDKAHLPLPTNRNFSDVVRKVDIQVKVRIANEELEGKIFVRPVFNSVVDALDSFKDHFIVLDQVASLRGRGDPMMFLNRSQVLFFAYQPG